jgi:REP element-mobilizing transposase RayT
MNRGDRRELIFMDDADRQRFVDTLGEACAKTGWQVHAYVLMPNHFHWVVETPQPNRVAGMKWLLGTDTSRFNRRHKFFGHLFSGRYKSLIVDGSGSGYLKKRGRLRPLESGASETGGSGRALEEFCLEQLAGVLARALETSGVVAGGSVAGRVVHLQGQSGGAATA